MDDLPTTYRSLIAAAIDDLASRLEVAPESIEVQFVEEVTWPDGALGCPQPGMSYTQALVEGLRIGLTHDGAIYAYHSALAGSPFLCESGLFVPSEVVGTIVFGKEPPSTIAPPDDK